MQTSVPHEWPPNIVEIRKALPGTIGRRGLLFSWGDKIYNPDNVSISNALYAHEAVHRRQQDAHPDGIEGWWRDYLRFRFFRCAQEVPAHHVEWNIYVAEGLNRHTRRSTLKVMRKRLTSPVYGLGLTGVEADAAILDGKLPDRDWS